MIPILGDVGKAGKWGVKTGKELLEEGDERVAKEGVETFGLKGFARADEFGIQTYKELRKMIRGSGLEAHHLIEKRFVRELSLKNSEIMSIALTKEEHKIFTRLWRQAIGYNGSFSPIVTNEARLKDIWIAAQQVYSEHPVLLESVKEILFRQ